MGCKCPDSKVRHCVDRQDTDFRFDRDTSKHLILLWFMVPKSATAVASQYGGLRNRHTSAVSASRQTRQEPHHVRHRPQPGNDDRADESFLAMMRITVQQGSIRRRREPADQVHHPHPRRPGAAPHGRSEATATISQIDLFPFISERCASIKAGRQAFVRRDNSRPVGGVGYRHGTLCQVRPATAAKPSRRTPPRLAQPKGANFLRGISISLTPSLHVGATADTGLLSPR
jgi:hypothetical protein